MSSPTDIKAVARSALARAGELLPAWLPGGRFQGREYECGNLGGGDGDSCRVNLDTGKWSDFATKDHGTDLVGLFAAINRMGQVEAARELSQALGVNGERKAPQGKKAADWLPILPVPADAPDPDFHHSRLGAPVATWTYRDGQGRVLGHVARFEAPEGKQVLPLTYCASPDGKMAWRWKSFSTPRPLYNLDHLAAAKPDTPVLVVEGEKTADAAQRLLPGAVALAWPGGAKAVGKADFTPLAGRTRVNICPDADKPGAEAALAVATKVMQAGAIEVFIVPPPPGAPEGWDLADPMPEGVTLETVIAGIISVEEFTDLARERYGIGGDANLAPTRTNDSSRA